MAKYFGEIGYGENKESLTQPGVYKLTITKRNVYGDFYKNTRILETTDNLHDNINVANKISFLADPYALKNFHLIKYASHMGTLWKVKSVEVEFPRLVLTLGGVYNDE